MLECRLNKSTDKCHPMRHSQMPMKSMVKVSSCASIISTNTVHGSKQETLGATPL